MILNSAVIERYLIDGKTYTDIKEFIDALLACTDLVADVYVNSKRVASGMLNLSVNNNWIIGNVDERLSIINMDAASSINIVVHQLGHNELEDIIMKSTSPLNTFIDPGDCDADLYFSIMSTVPECTQRCYVPDSVFNAMGTNNITPKDFDNPVECPDDPTLPEPEPGDVEVLYDKVGTGIQLFASGSYEPDDSKGYIWTLKSGEYTCEVIQWSNTTTYQPDGDGDYLNVLSSVDAGESLIVSLAEDESGNIVFTDVIAVKNHTAVCTFNEGAKTFDCIIYDKNEHIVSCDPEKTYMFDVIVGAGGKGGKGGGEPPAYISVPDFTGEQLILHVENVDEYYSEAWVKLTSGATTGSVAINGTDITFYSIPATIESV